ncbi:hypothetical protein [Microvirga lotononidis]|uniref:Uncharacterized protein n=1 Tax=Microvirga lotononidis TaxID=864069 RepID=I4YNG0_9HYPH|nr:hypothetical protein [Microvirga lotononidis]EIM25502.1 hypothetical protein MicloDRAFT_00062290 [Microvirga lotononidis]WQO26188.1 hypothetical protein U0023_15965 [Microvirga lotononidis]
MKAYRLGTTALLAGLWICPAAAQELPRFNVEATCKEAQPLVPQDTNPYDSCMRDETAAQRQLREIWNSTAESVRATCAREAQIGGTPSYVDMLTCLQVAQGLPPTNTSRSRKPAQ